MKAVALVVVVGGVAHVYAPDGVDVRVIDLDNAAGPDGDPPEVLPRGVGFGVLTTLAGLEVGKDYVWAEQVPA